MNAHAERLRGIVDALEVQDQLPRSRQFISDAADELERLQAQVEELQKDKMRLDWCDEQTYKMTPPELTLDCCPNNDFRAFLDKIMEVK